VFPAHPDYSVSVRLTSFTSRSIRVPCALDKLDNTRDFHAFGGDCRTSKVSLGLPAMPSIEKEM
jgi:hypothetical protein